MKGEKIGSCKLMIGGKEVGLSGTPQLPRQKIEIEIETPIREISFTCKLAFDAKGFWLMKLLAIGGCRNPRGMQ